MTESGRRRPMWVLLGVVLAVAGAGVAIWATRPARTALPPTEADLAGLPEPIRQQVQSGQATLITRDPGTPEAQEAMSLAHRVMRDQLRNYTRMSPEEKKKHLDEQIDQQERLRQSGAMSLAVPGTQPSTQPAGQPERRVFVRRGGGDDKEMMESMDPELRAMLAQYASDLRQRRAERGLPDAPGMVMIQRQTLPR